MLSSFGSKIGL